MAKSDHKTPEHTRHTSDQAEHHLRHAEKRLGQSRQLNVISMVMLVLGLATLGTGAYLVQRANQATPKATSTVAAPRATALGQALATAAYNLRLSDLKYDQTGDDTYKPASGNEFVVITLTISNLTSQSLQFLPVLQTYLKDSRGKSYSLTPAPLDSPIQSGSLLPGDTISGQVSYEVPIGTTDLNLYFDSGWPGAGGAAVMSLAP